MKCLIIALFIAFIAVVMAVEKTSETEKNVPEAVDANRDKRGLIGAYYASSYVHPYSVYPYSYPYSYPYYRYRYEPYNSYPLYY